MIADRSIPIYGQKKVNAGEALKHLLKFFSEDNNIIDVNWSENTDKINIVMPVIIFFLLLIKKLIIFVFLVSLFIADMSSSILNHVP